jgi:hypothetical protein
MNPLLVEFGLARKETANDYINNFRLFYLNNFTKRNREDYERFVVEMLKYYEVFNVLGYVHRVGFSDLIHNHPTLGKHPLFPVVVKPKVSLNGQIITYVAKDKKPKFMKVQLAKGDPLEVEIAVSLALKRTKWKDYFCDVDTCLQIEGNVLFAMNEDPAYESNESIVKDKELKKAIVLNPIIKPYSLAEMLHHLKHADPSRLGNAPQMLQHRLLSFLLKMFQTGWETGFTHNDLHASNVLYNGKHFVAIDFGRSYIDLSRVFDSSSNVIDNECVKLISNPETLSEIIRSNRAITPENFHDYIEAFDWSNRGTVKNRTIDQLKRNKLLKLSDENIWYIQRTTILLDIIGLYFNCIGHCEPLRHLHLQPLPETFKDSERLTVFRDVISIWFHLYVEISTSDEFVQFCKDRNPAFLDHVKSATDLFSSVGGQPSILHFRVMLCFYVKKILEHKDIITVMCDKLVPEPDNMRGGGLSASLALANVQSVLKNLKTNSIVQAAESPEFKNFTSIMPSTNYADRDFGDLLNTAMTVSEQRLRHEEEMQRKFGFDDDAIIEAFASQYSPAMSSSANIQRAHYLQPISPAPPMALVAAGGTVKGPKRSKEHVYVEGKRHVVYIGPRGGRYIRKNSKFISFSDLNV